MKKVTISFEADFDSSDDDFKKDVNRQLSIYARSNGMSVDKVSVNIEKIQPYIDHYCRGFGCALSVMCLRFQLWMNGKAGYKPYFDHCDENKRDGFVSIPK